MAKALSIIDEIKSIAPAKPGGKLWFDKLTDPAVIGKLREVHAARKAGNLDEYSKTQLHDICKRKFGLKIGIQAFVAWLDGELT